jgi:hypothetical protein
MSDNRKQQSQAKRQARPALRLVSQQESPQAPRLIEEKFRHSAMSQKSRPAGGHDDDPGPSAA